MAAPYREPFGFSFRRPSHSILNRFVARLLIQLLVLSSFPAHVQAVAALFPVSVLWVFVGEDEPKAASDGVVFPQLVPVDANGNQTSKTENGQITNYSYDVRDKLVEVTQGASILARYQYDFEGRRTLKIGLQGPINYVYDQTSVFAEYAYNDGWYRVAKYDYGSDRLISMDRFGEGKRYYSFDGLRSVVNLTGDDGAVTASYHLDAWGNYRFPDIELPKSQNRFGFTGYMWDAETGLYNAKARYFDPKIGRFISQDSFLGNVDNPPSLHRYFYGYANPTRYWDPTGNAVFDTDDPKTAAEAILGQDPNADPTGYTGLLLKEKYGAKEALHRLAKLHEKNPLAKAAVVTIEEDDLSNGKVDPNKVYQQFLWEVGRFAEAIPGLREAFYELVRGKHVGDFIDISELYSLARTYSILETFKYLKEHTSDSFFKGGIEKNFALAGLRGIAPRDLVEEGTLGAAFDLASAYWFGRALYAGGAGFLMGLREGLKDAAPALADGVEELAPGAAAAGSGITRS